MHNEYTHLHHISAGQLRDGTWNVHVWHLDPATRAGVTEVIIPPVEGIDEGWSYLQFISNAVYQLLDREHAERRGLSS